MDELKDVIIEDLQEGDYLVPSVDKDGKLCYKNIHQDDSEPHPEEYDISRPHS